MGVGAHIMKATPSIPLERACREAADSCMGRRIRRVARAVTAHYDRALKPVGLKGTQFTLLTGLFLMQDAPLTQLAEQLGLDRTTLSRNLQPLERDGLVKSANSEDRRKRQLVLTERGRQILADAMPYWREAQAEVRKKLGTQMGCVAQDLEELLALNTS